MTLLGNVLGTSVDSALDILDGTISVGIDAGGGTTEQSDGVGGANETEGGMKQKGGEWSRWSKWHRWNQ